MFNVTMSIKEFIDYVGFWGGASVQWEIMTAEERNYIQELLDSEAYTFDSLRAVNDFVWFDVPALLEEWHEELENTNEDDE